MREKGINNMKWRMEKENKTLGKERCENIDILYIKYYYCYYYYYSQILNVD